MVTVNHLVKADRLAAITQRIGFALWQLQELEWATTNYLVVRLRAKRGIGEEAGGTLLKSVGKRPFGSLLKELSDAGVLEPELAQKLQAVLKDRNWLVHRSRRENRAVLTSDEQCATLIAKLESISAEALSMLKQVGQLLERYVLESGVSKEFIDQESERLLVQWGIIE